MTLNGGIFSLDFETLNSKRSKSLTCKNDTTYNGAYNSPLGTGTIKLFNFFSDTLVNIFDYLTDGWCGPYISDNKFQSSVKKGSHNPRTALGRACKKHDNQLAQGVNWQIADAEFIQEAGDLGNLGSLYAKMVKSRNTTLQKFRGPPPSTNAPKAAGKSGNKNNGSQVSGPRSINAKIKAEIRKTENSLTRAPVSMSRKVAMSTPRYYSRNGTVAVTHSEYIGTVNAATAFTTTTYSVNPGSSTVFPWLSNVAANYNKYKFNRLRFVYVPAASTSTKGRVALAFNSNTLDVIPATKQAMFSIAPNDEESIWNEVAIDIPAHYLKNEQYVRTYPAVSTANTIGTSVDLKTYDVGRLIFASDLGSDTSSCGELYVSFDVTLSEPRSQLPPVCEVLSSTLTGGTNMFPVSGLTIQGANFIADSNVVDELYCYLNGRVAVSVYVTGAGISSIQLTSGSVGSINVLATRAIINAAATTLSGVYIIDFTPDSVSGIGSINMDLTATSTTGEYIIFSKLPEGYSW